MISYRNLEEIMIVFNEIRGLIRVGTIRYVDGKAVHPSFEGFTPIVVMTRSSEYGELSPYVLRDKDGSIMENSWQFRKVYSWVPDIEETYSRWDNTVIWKHCKETHVDSDGEPNDRYWKWREKGLRNEYPVRYPVGRTNHRRLCQYVLAGDRDDPGERLGVYEGRKHVYLPIYANAVKKEKKFKDLRRRLRNGENLLIIEVDGPKQESLQYYKDRYSVSDSFIEDDTMLVDMVNIGIMMEDTLHSFGHGYCLAMALMGWV